MLTSKTILTMTTAAALCAAPVLAFGQPNSPGTNQQPQTTQTSPSDGTPGNPPSTATQRALDAVTGNRTDADGTGNNPPGTAAGRAIDRATGNAPAAGASATGATTPGMAVDSLRLRDGRRASQVIGSTVYNENNESIGEVDDLIVPSAGGQPVAVISVGGFLGIGARLVAVPYERLTHNAERNRWMLQGATKEGLQALPAFNYDNNRRG
ncbi:PRC-barrel domain containing protein [Roseomonas stagni]|uniref:PRC-barrel domain containing protein n=1 Tax=Falsiroseomonas algicola TaxID=2716930 RepID=A0A6M1LLX7_9PROT|nr:PRC-barrel domain-containing protein [Falsiroseomonas algicola]NGM21336.1 PRC-barrel domain containing protein [Falsiroseomonas algicola]